MKPFAKKALPLVFAALYASSCAGTREAIESREMSTSIKMSETIFLEPVEPSQKLVWVHVRNTSDRQDLDSVKIESSIAANLARRGYKVTDSPNAARYRLEANILFADHERTGLTEEGMLLGGFGGAVLGSVIGGDKKSQTAAAVGGAVAGAVIGGIAGSMVHVDKYMLVVDVQIAEKKKSSVGVAVSGETTAGKVTEKRNTSDTSDFMNYRTRVVGTAKQTNLKWEKAQPVLLEGFASSLAGIF